MPLYYYNCDVCGPFQSHAPMKRYKVPATCPTCGAKCPRKMSVPFVADLAPAIGAAHLRNEKSAEEPVVMNRRQFEKTGRHLHELREPHDHHGADIGHGAATRLEPGLRRHAAPDRPWLLGH